MTNFLAKGPNGLAKLVLPKPSKKNPTLSRRHSRHDCVVIATMKLVDLGAEFDGAILDISRGGCTFRQASMFVLDRIGETVHIRTEFFETEGRIRAARAEGYGVQFFTEIEDQVIERLVAEYGFNIADSFLAKRN
jgi:hypothetical protein